MPNPMSGLEVLSDLRKAPLMTQPINWVATAEIEITHDDDSENEE